MAERTTWLHTHRGHVADVVTAALRATRIAGPEEISDSYAAREAATDAMVDLHIVCCVWAHRHAV